MVPKCPAQDTVTLCSIAVQVWTENAMLNRWAAFLPKSSNIKASAYAPDCGEKKKKSSFLVENIDWKESFLQIVDSCEKKHC